LEARLQALVVDLAEAGVLQSAHDVSEGGLAVALAECACSVDDEARMLGARIELEAASAGVLFGEAPSRIVISAKADAVPEIERRAAASAVPVRRLGETGGSRLTIYAAGAPVIDVDLGDARRARETCLEPIVGT
jgi:phosphoribosylformylglycinamidine synthase